MSSSNLGSPVTTSNPKASFKSEYSVENNLESIIMEDLRKQVFQGQLYKFTNVVKGWQYRWFELHPETGQLEYYYYEDHGLHDLVSGKDKARKIGNKGKKEHIAGAVVVPSEEDSQTFYVNFASGESYKLRAPNVKERQIWVDRIRAVSQLHDRAIAQSNPPVGKNVLLNHHENFPEPPPGSRTHLNKRGEPSDALQNLSLSVLDAFGSVHDILYQSNLKHQMLTEAIDALPMQAPDKKSDKGCNDANGPFCHDDDLLILKATSQSALACMESALALLQDIREAQRDNQIHGKAKDHHHKSSSAATNSIKSSKMSGLLSPMTMSPSRKISNSSTNSNFYIQDTTEHMISNTSLNQTDDGVSSLKHFGGKQENRPHADTLSIKSANVPHYDHGARSVDVDNNHPMASSLSRSTPSVVPEQTNRTGSQSLSHQNVNSPKKEAQAQTS